MNSVYIVHRKGDYNKESRARKHTGKEDTQNPTASHSY